MPKSIAQRAGLLFVILLFAGSGTLHFIVTDLFASIIPPSLPLRREAVYISGACELAGALGLCLPRRRRLAGQHLHVAARRSFPAGSAEPVDLAAATAACPACGHLERLHRPRRQFRASSRARGRNLKQSSFQKSSNFSGICLARLFGAKRRQ